jgi:hypothetical protein
MFEMIYIFEHEKISKCFKLIFKPGELKNFYFFIKEINYFIVFITSLQVLAIATNYKYRRMVIYFIYKDVDDEYEMRNFVFYGNAYVYLVNSIENRTKTK